MLEDLIKIADALDAKGMNDEAGKIDRLIAQNIRSIKRASGNHYPEMDHEEHSAIEETPEFSQYQAEEEYRRDLDAAYEVAKHIILGKTPHMIQEDLRDEAGSLADILVGSEHMNTVYVIRGFLASNGWER
tara:strand:- start:2146 stop:2538 length:393 start_codon:yes stop_codon:yes gene_type:complete